MASWRAGPSLPYGRPTLSASVQLRRTPFHDRHVELCESYQWRRWAGYTLPVSYGLSHEREYHAVRSTAALFDVSPLYKYTIAGPDALRLLNRVLVRDLSSCKVGQVRYTVWCNEKGQVLDDGTVARLADQLFRLTAAEPTLRWLQDNALGMDVVVRDRSDETAALALQGPAARTILGQVARQAVDSLPYYRLTQSEIAGRPVQISRTGYTGDLGYELWLDAEDGPAIWDALMTVGEPYGLLPAGLLALDMARLEAGLLLADVDYRPANKALIDAQSSTPYELGLGWLVDLDKAGYFVGRDALAQAMQQGARWQVVGLEVDWPSLEKIYEQVGLPVQVPSTPWRESVPLYRRGREVGYATSGCFSPLLKRPIALATVHSDVSAPGTELEIETTVEHMRRRAKARVVKLPFFNPPRKRASFSEGEVENR